MKEILLSPTMFIIYGIILGYLIEWFVKHAKTTETKSDDFIADMIVEGLKKADEYFTDPLFNNLFGKALEVLDAGDKQEKETSILLKKSLEKIEKK